MNDPSRSTQPSLGLEETRAEVQDSPNPVSRPSKELEPTHEDSQQRGADLSAEAIHSRDRDGGTAPSPGGAQLARGRELVAKGRIREAVDLYRQVVSDHPLSLKARNNLGVLYDEMGQHELALEQFEAARAIDPANVEVLANLGAALLWLARFEEAEQELGRALGIDPESVDVHANLGILCFRRGLYGQAETELRWVCERDRDHARAHYYLGESLNRLGRVDLAIDVLQRAVHLQPRNSKAYYTLGILFDRKHMPEEAGRMYKKARELAP